LLEQNRYEKKSYRFFVVLLSVSLPKKRIKERAADHPPFSLLATKRDCPALLKSAVS
jgi:hypothetical protein